MHLVHGQTHKFKVYHSFAHLQVQRCLGYQLGFCVRENPDLLRMVVEAGSPCPIDMVP